MVKLCPGCGLENEDIANFCKKCGTPIPDDLNANEDISSENPVLNGEESPILKDDGNSILEEKESPILKDDGNSILEEKETPILESNKNSGSKTNKNKSSNNTLVIAVVAILCVVVAGAFILSWYGNHANVGGIDFNIPEGFTENEDYAIDSEYDEESDAYFSFTAFEDDSNQNAILVGVIEPAGDSVDELTLAYSVGNLNPKRKNINGHSGYIVKVNDLASSFPILDNGDNLYGFLYEENGKIVIVASDDTSYFEEVIR